MQVELSRLTAVEVPLRGEVLVSDDAAGDARSLARDGIRFPRPIAVDAIARRAADEVVVAGRISGEVELECSRCLAHYSMPLDVTFRARFAEARAPAASRPTLATMDDDEDSPPMDEDDFDLAMLPAGTRALSVDEIVREQALLQVPLRPLCRPECAGLCARCGAELNAGPCACPPQPVSGGDARLAALADIRRRLESR